MSKKSILIGILIMFLTNKKNDFFIYNNITDKMSRYIVRNAKIDHSNVRKEKIIPKSIKITTKDILKWYKYSGLKKNKSDHNIKAINCLSQDIYPDYAKNNIYMLNFANARYPGINFPNRGTTQEEVLLRCFPELYVSLVDTKPYLYPIEKSLIITEPCIKIRDGKGIRTDNNFKMSFITIAAPDTIYNPNKILKDMLSIFIVPLMNSFKHKNKHKPTLVIGAWGLGAFYPRQIEFNKMKIDYPDIMKKYEKYEHFMLYYMKKISKTFSEHYEQIIFASPSKYFNKLFNDY